MINALLKIAIGWFVTYKAVRIVGAKGRLAIAVKIAGVLLMILGTVSFVHLLTRF